VKVTTTLKVMR